MQLLGLVLVPDERSSARVTECARSIVPRVGPVRSMLGEGALPHVSFVHIYSDRPADDIWAEVSPVMDEMVTIEPIGVRFHPYHVAYNSPEEAGGGIVTFLQVLLDAELWRMRQNLKTTSWFQEGEIRYPSNDAFDPHFTLGSTTPLSGFTVQSSVELPDDLIGQPMNMRLALGPIGPWGVLQQVVAGGW
jgi:hypothetical protein